jgi:outer membrane lipopolysaccharide assembly protein LptE/RlpB
MTKKIKTALVTILPLLLLACGFKPLSQRFDNQVYIQNIDIEADKSIAYSLKNNILFLSNENSENKYDVKIQIKKNQRNKIKDKSGKTTRYGVTLTANLELTNLNNNIIKTKTFSRSADYDESKIYSDTIENKKSAIKNIIETLSGDIVNFIVISSRF